MRHVDAEVIDSLIRSVLTKMGMSAMHAGLVANGLVETSLLGVDSHGVRLFSTYLKELRGGRSRLNPHMTFEARAPAALSVDAGGALGIVAGSAAADRAIELAKTFGIGAVCVRNSNHFGAAGIYARRMARAGQIGLAFSHSDALVAAHQGHRPRFGTNPMAVAAYGHGNELFCLDMATSETSYSRLLLDPAQLPAAVGSGAGPVLLRPLGGYKGQGIAMLIEMLCALLAGAPFDHQLSHFYTAPFGEPRLIAHFFISIAVEAFLPLGEFQARLSELMAAVREDDVCIAGDAETRAMEARRVKGIPLSDDQFDAFASAAAEHGVPFPCRST